MGRVSVSYILAFVSFVISLLLHILAILPNPRHLPVIFVAVVVIMIIYLWSLLTYWKSTDRPLFVAKWKIYSG